VISFVETKLFTRIVGEYLSDSEYAELQQALRKNPELGPMICASVLRKIRDEIDA
jgi:hypothetical protein